MIQSRYLSIIKKHLLRVKGSKVIKDEKVVVTVEEIPEDLKSCLLQKYELIDLSGYLKDYKRINNYERNGRDRWNSILKELPEFKKPSVVIFRTYLILDSYLLSLFPDKILYLRAGSGYDNIDIDYAFSHGSFIENTPAANTNAAVEHSIALLFGSLKKINVFNSSIKAGLWRDNISLNREISGKNILIIGFGNIGSEVASVVKSLGGNVFVYDPYKSMAGSLDKFASALNTFQEKNEKEPSVDSDPDKDWQYWKEKLYELTGKADIISFHLTLHDKTYKMINKEFLFSCKKDLILINSARGEIFEEDDVYDFFSINKNAFLASDVFPFEPYVEGSKLLKLENAIFSPHVGAYTYEARERLTEEVIRSIDAYFKDGTILNPVDKRFRFSPYFQN